MHARPEDIAEHLNALFTRSGALAEIRRGPSELTSTFDMESDDEDRSRDDQQREQADTMAFWWQRAGLGRGEEELTPLIGKVRIVPYNRTRSLLVTAPPEYMSTIENLIRALDMPARQVLLQAIVAEVRLEDLSSLGIRFASSAFSTDSADFATLSLTEFDSVLDFSGGTLAVGTDLLGLIQYLQRETDLRVRASPLIFTEDNKEGEIFEGQEIPFITNSQTTDQGGLTQSFDYKRVGITLRVLPHITDAGDVDMNVSIEASARRPGETLFGGEIFDSRRSTSHLVVKNGQTIILSGIIRQEDREIVRKFPILGDIPVLDLVFSHRETVTTNTELLIFLTPTVAHSPEEAARIGAESYERMQQINPPRMIELNGEEE